ncbi:MAG: thioredoxin family protein [Rhodobacter sp.]|nr:thioredoxin family protein [Rhodobacter sp.]
MLTRLALICLTAMFAALPARAAELVMVEEIGCIYCAQWDAEIAEIYPKTPEGQTAPLVRVMQKSAELKAYTLARPVVYTPTFLLVEDNTELARIEGYPGEDFFWGLLEMFLTRHVGFEAAS